MKVLFFSSQTYDEDFFNAANVESVHECVFLKSQLNEQTACLAQGAKAICVFVNDELNEAVLKQIAQQGVKLIALRCAGYNNVDVTAAKALGLKVVRVPAYSPSAVAELAVGLMLSLGRKIHRAHQRVKEGNFSLDGLLGFDFSGRTAGIVGTGQIGSIVARILKAMGMRVIAYDPHPSDHPDLEYVELERLWAESDVISLHCPLMPSTCHLVNAEALAKMRPGVMLINTSRGGVLDTVAVIDALKTGQLGYLGIDVYEQESALFFQDLSCQVIEDDVFQRLLMFPNVLVTAHQGFFTEEAMTNIAQTTLKSISDFELERPLECLLEGF